MNGLHSGNCIEFYGAEGLGKTTLLRYLSSQPQIQMPNGMVFIDKCKTLDDLLEELFEAFYYSNQIYKPTSVEYKRYFEGIKALILLDNFSLTREETQVLLNTLPNCVFVLASFESHLLGQGNVVHLSGLPLGDAVELFKWQINRQLSQNEAPIARSICSALQGNPLNIIRAAALVREDGKSIHEVARQIPGADPKDQILEQVLGNLSESAKSILALLATFKNSPLPAEHINEMIPNVQLGTVIKTLLNRGLVKAHSPSYSLTGNLELYLAGNWSLAGWDRAVLKHFVNWTARSPSHEQILDSAQALMTTLENAATSNRWQEILQIGMVIEPNLVIGRALGNVGEIVEFADAGWHGFKR